MTRESRPGRPGPQSHKAALFSPDLPGPDRLAVRMIQLAAADLQKPQHRAGAARFFTSDLFTRCMGPLVGEGERPPLGWTWDQLQALAEEDQG